MKTLLASILLFFGVTQAFAADPSEEPVIPVSPEAPESFKAMKHAYNSGDLQAAAGEADNYVRYMQKLMLEVRELSQLVGEALVRQGVIDEEDWVGVGQYLSKEMATSRSEKGDLLGVTADLSLERIEADPSNRAEIYVFISPSSRYSREMGPDIERMRRIAQRDSRIKFGVYSVGPQDSARMEAFKSYTGLNAPVQDGTALAKQFRVAFVPSVVVRAPTTNKLYLRTGALEISRLIEFVRTVQGLPQIVSDSEFSIIEAKVGSKEQQPATSSNGIVRVSYRGNSDDSAPTIEKF